MFLRKYIIVKEPRILRAGFLSETQFVHDVVVFMETDGQGNRRVRVGCTEHRDVSKACTFTEDDAKLISRLLTNEAKSKSTQYRVEAKGYAMEAFKHTIAK